MSDFGVEMTLGRRVSVVAICWKRTGERFLPLHYNFPGSEPRTLAQTLSIQEIVVPFGTIVEKPFATKSEWPILRD